MPPKKKTPAPIDRPLSRAYLRNFTGWSTAYPPGHSEPTSLREMENMLVDRNGSLTVRPGLKYISYAQSPDTDPLVDDAPGIAIDKPLVGSQEPFYVEGGKKALLFAVREDPVDPLDNPVGEVSFRALLFSDTNAVVHRLTDPEIGFEFPQGEAVLNFSPATTHVEYLQIDNKIIAMSDKGETIRLFFVGDSKRGKRPQAITAPKWEDGDKLKVVHPDAAWVNKQGTTSRRNEVFNPSFEVGDLYWIRSTYCAATVTVGSNVSGTRRVQMSSLPTRTNMQTSPLHSVATTGTAGWYPHKTYGLPTLSKDGAFMRIYDKKSDGTFLAYGAKLTVGVAAAQKYQIALDYEIGTHVQPIVVLTFYNAAGAKIGKSTSLEMPKKNGHYLSPSVTSPGGTVSMRVSLGGRNEKDTSTYIKVKNVLLCKAAEADTFFHGGSGTNFFWTGAVNSSASVYHPPVDIALVSGKYPIKAGAPYGAAASVTSTLAPRAYQVRVRSYNKDNVLQHQYPTAGTTVLGSWTRTTAGTATATIDETLADVVLFFPLLPRGALVYADAVILESGTATPGTYFDGSTAPTTTAVNSWGNATLAHKTYSVQTVKVDPAILPPAETPTVKTLIASGGAASNPFKMAFFYTFSNEVGESAPSKMTEVRMSRAWSNWFWEKPNAAGEPGGEALATEVDTLCADQLVVWMPQAVYDQAVQEGALKWNLYSMTWSDQAAVPPVAQLISEKLIYPEEVVMQRAAGLGYNEGGWIAVTPQRKISLVEAPLPTKDNRYNYSNPPRSRTGLVAGDRLIMLGDPTALATIRWTSNQPGEYTNFTSSRGGGAKTLTSGNLNIPGQVVLWQNPQSVDTLTVLCLSQDGQSVSYYMQPASVNAQSSSIAGMGFEETTSTPGSTSPYGGEVLNNALFRPTDKALLKSTASNYNISHKQLTDTVANLWWSLRQKEWIMSAQLNNRLCFLVNNPFGELLEDGCKGNELWVYDINAENGFWSRFLIQGAALRVFSLGGRDYLGVTRPEGLYYLDPDARLDDYVDVDLKVLQRPIPWRFETNTQGANRAHDAWAHLQQVQITVGNFTGTMEYGIRGQDVNHQRINTVKRLSDDRQIPEDEARWDIDDIMQVRRDMKEWFFYASSVEGIASWGEVGYVQYRYTPVSVNVGYEYGSLETFEYGQNVLSGPNGYSDNGIPVPVMDYTRP